MSVDELRDVIWVDKLDLPYSSSNFLKTYKIPIDLLGILPTIGLIFSWLLNPYLTQQAQAHQKQGKFNLLSLDGQTKPGRLVLSRSIGLWDLIYLNCY